MVSKAPLVTFLESTAPPAAEVSSSQNPEAAPASSTTKPSPGDEMREGACAVILTILSNTAPISSENLKVRSEIDAHLYEQTLQDLMNSGLVVEQHGGYALSPRGIDAAAQQRARILNIA